MDYCDWVFHIRASVFYGGSFIFRRIKHGQETKYYHYIEISGYYDHIIMSVNNLKTEQWSELINCCIYHNPHLLIDKVVKDIFINKKSLHFGLVHLDLSENNLYKLGLERPDKRFVDVVGNEAYEARILSLRRWEVQILKFGG